MDVMDVILSLLSGLPLLLFGLFKDYSMKREAELDEERRRAWLKKREAKLAARTEGTPRRAFWHKLKHFRMAVKD